MKKLLVFMAALSMGFSCFSATAFDAASPSITADIKHSLMQDLGRSVPGCWLRRGNI